MPVIPAFRKPSEFKANSLRVTGDFQLHGKIFKEKKSCSLHTWLAVPQESKDY